MSGVGRRGTKALRVVLRFPHRRGSQGCGVWLQRRRRPGREAGRAPREPGAGRDAGCPGPGSPSSRSSSSASGPSCFSQTLWSPPGRPAGSSGSSFPGSAGSKKKRKRRVVGGARRLPGRAAGGAGAGTHPRVLQHLLDPPVAVGDAAPQPELRREEDHGAPGWRLRTRRAAAPKRFRVSAAPGTSGSLRVRPRRPLPRSGAHALVRAQPAGISRPLPSGRGRGAEGGGRGGAGAGSSPAARSAWVRGRPRAGNSRARRPRAVRFPPTERPE